MVLTPPVEPPTFEGSIRFDGTAATAIENGSDGPNEAHQLAARALPTTTILADTELSVLIDPPTIDHPIGRQQAGMVASSGEPSELIIDHAIVGTAVVIVIVAVIAGLEP
jgi:hypothetical protein